RKLYPNVDFYSGLIYQAMGFPVEMFPVLFAIPRMSGWLAQWQEMRDDPEQKIARPRQLYQGAGKRAYVEMGRRGAAPPPGGWRAGSCFACGRAGAGAAPTPDPDELDPAEGLRLVRRLAAFGHPAPHLVLTGGDPLKRVDLFGLIAAAREAGLGVSVAPSATPLLTPAVIRRLREARVEAISLSLDAAAPARHDALRGVPGCFDRTLRAAQAAREAGLPFQINSLVSRQTVDDLPAIYELARRSGAARWSLFFLVAVGRGTVLDPISPVECEQLLETLAGLAARPGLPVVTTTEAPHFRRVVSQRGGGMPRAHRLGIRDGNGIMFITHAGDVYPSGFLALSVGSVREGGPRARYRGFPGLCGVR